MSTSQISPEQDSQAGLLSEPHDFSLVLGGPLYQLLRRTRLEGDQLELLYRRMIIIPLLAWLPLLLFALFGSLGETSTRISFFRDVEVHARFLLALPVLIAAELLVHTRLRPVIRRFVERRMVPPSELPRFHGAVDRAIRLRNSVPLEVALLVIVYTAGLWVGNGRVPMHVATWYGPEVAGTLLLRESGMSSSVSRSSSSFCCGGM